MVADEVGFRYAAVCLSWEGHQRESSSRGTPPAEKQSAVCGVLQERGGRGAGAHSSSPSPASPSRSAAAPSPAPSSSMRSSAASSWPHSAPAAGACSSTHSHSTCAARAASPLRSRSAHRSGRCRAQRPPWLRNMQAADAHGVQQCCTAVPCPLDQASRPHSLSHEPVVGGPACGGARTAAHERAAQTAAHQVWTAGAERMAAPLWSRRP